MCYVCEEMKAAGLTERGVHPIEKMQRGAKYIREHMDRLERVAKEGAQDDGEASFLQFVAAHMRLIIAIADHSQVVAIPMPEQPDPRSN